MPVYNILQRFNNCTYNSAKIQNKISKDFTHFKDISEIYQNNHLHSKLLVSPCSTFSKHVCFMRPAQMPIFKQDWAKHCECPDPLLAPRCSRGWMLHLLRKGKDAQYIDLYRRKNARQPKHQTLRSSWITISRTSQNLHKVYNKYIVPVYNILQCFNNCTTQRKFKTKSYKISKDFTHLKDISE